jgi:uncharacterized protein (DUF433 family)
LPMPQSLPIVFPVKEIHMTSITTNEAVALFGFDERWVRKEVEHGVLGAERPPRFDLAALVYLRSVMELGFEIGAVEDRKRLYGLISAAIHGHRHPDVVRLSAIAELHIGRMLEETETRATRFDAWKRRLVVDERILGGEPVFPKSRLAVRHVGGMRLKGTPAAEIREDYPYLKDEDIEFAALYAQANPRMGRPRERQAAP